MGVDQAIPAGILQAALPGPSGQTHAWLSTTSKIFSAPPEFLEPQHKTWPHPRPPDAMPRSVALGQPVTRESKSTLGAAAAVCVLEMTSTLQHPRPPPPSLPPRTLHDTHAPLPGLRFDESLQLQQIGILKRR